MTNEKYSAKEALGAVSVLLETVAMTRKDPAETWALRFAAAWLLNASRDDLPAERTEESVGSPS